MGRKGPGEPDEEPQDAQKLERDFLDALTPVLQKHDPGCIVVKMIVLAEVVDASGQRALWTAAGPDMKSWDTAGMLQHAMQIQAGQTMAEAVGNVLRIGNDDD